jgi:hypothetical protein
MFPKGDLHRVIGAAAVLSALALPVAASANTNDYAMRTGPPTIHGVITSIQGPYDLTIRDDRANDESITLHRGTVINPTGLQLRPGMQVTIAGHPGGRTFNADEIDAPAGDVNETDPGAQRNSAPLDPSFSPSGTFQTNGPSADGGGA